MNPVGILASRVQSDSDLLEQIATFFAMGHLTLIHGVIGVALLGASCGMLGSFVMLRRMSLMGDSIAHAVLPGICVAFIIAKTKNVPAIFVGAIVAGTIAAWTISAITKHSKLKADTAVGLILSGFFGLGIVLLTRIQRMPFGDQSGLDKYLFGDAAALGRSDLQMMAIVTGIVLFVVVGFFRYLQVTTFDEAFASSIGIPVRWVQLALMSMLALAIVVALQAVGVVLVSAILITPAATAYLLTDRLRTMVILSACIGVISGLVGLFLSFILYRVPTGPCVVLSASFWFVLAYLFSPKQGVIQRLFLRIRRARRVRGENMLKSAFGLLDSGDTFRELSFSELGGESSYSPTYIQRVAKSLARARMANLTDRGMALTPSGYRRAAQIVRNHRLWELFLAKEASLAPDHVHRDAEEIEHVLGEEMVARLEAMLDHPEVDPHGRKIPLRAESPESPARSSDGDRHVR